MITNRYEARLLLTRLAAAALFLCFTGCGDEEQKSDTPSAGATDAATTNAGADVISDGAAADSLTKDAVAGGADSQAGNPDVQKAAVDTQVVGGSDSAQPDSSAASDSASQATKDTVDGPDAGTCTPSLAACSSPVDEKCHCKENYECCQGDKFNVICAPVLANNNDLKFCCRDEGIQCDTAEDCCQGLICTDKKCTKQ